jgi:ParB-like chromosome segregation protein Spo0J
MKSELYQFLPCLSLDEYEALRESIRENGVIEPVVVDERGEVIDGHHRVKVCKELGIEYPVRVIEGLGEERKQNLSIELNMTGRELTKDQKKDLAISLFEKGWTQERIALRMKVNQSTISRWLENMQMHNADQRSPTLNKDDLLTLKLQLDDASKREETLKSEIEALRAAGPRVIEKVIEKPALPDAGELERLVSERVAERAGALEKARREAYNMPAGQCKPRRGRERGEPRSLDIFTGDTHIGV